ncbi:MAG: hypothetical protein AAGK17_08165 [Pseudomonadota bacterium]
MTSPTASQPLFWPAAAWLATAIAGFIAPVTALLILANTPASPPVAVAVSPILALGMMGAGIIAASIIGKFWTGVGLALLNAVCLFGVSIAVGAPLQVGAAFALAALIASLSFAARGALFALSGAGKGWLIALFVVAGEAAILLTAMAMPDALPGWLLALLPAQWANMALAAALDGVGLGKAVWALIALAATALATLLVVRLWPKRWTYSVMFTTWIAMSALVYYQPGVILG